MELFNQRWQGTVRGYAVILEAHGSTFTVQIIGRRSHAYRYERPDHFFLVGPNGENAGCILEGALLFERLFDMKAVAMKSDVGKYRSRWPLDEVKKVPEFMAFLGEYRHFKEVAEKAEPALSREEARPYLRQIKTSAEQIERRSLQHGEDAVRDLS